MTMTKSLKGISLLLGSQKKLQFLQDQLPPPPPASPDPAANLSDDLEEESDGERDKFQVCLSVSSCMFSGCALALICACGCSLEQLDLEEDSGERKPSPQHGSGRRTPFLVEDDQSNLEEDSGFIVKVVSVALFLCIMACWVPKAGTREASYF